MTRDMEMSCDEKVMKNFGEDIRADYSYSLLNLAVNRSSRFNIPISFSENNIKARIKNILSYKKPKKTVIFIVILVIVSSILFLISNPKNNNLNNSKYLIENIKLLEQKRLLEIEIEEKIKLEKETRRKLEEKEKQERLNNLQKNIKDILKTKKKTN